MDSGIGQFIPLILIITIVVVVIKLRNKGRQTRIEEFNKKHGTKFKNELELNYYIATKLEKKDKEQTSNLGSDLKEGFKNIKQSIKTDEIDDYKSEDDIGFKLKKLKKMYNDGHLSKVEFEKAKNKLLK
jgi:hypothetical protein